MKILQEPFGELKGQAITAYTMVNNQGMEVTAIDYGCIITKITAPDRNGTFENVVLGFDTVDEYALHSPYFGAVVGRFAGRIAGAEFELEGKKYLLAKNDNGNHLHGGLQGFDKIVWAAETVEKADAVSVVFSYLSKDGEEGYPGNFDLKVTYTLTDDNELQVSYTGETDQTTLVNVTNHSYFNLSGELKRDILNHQLTLKSDQFLELDPHLIPTGEFLSVENTAFDFRNGRKIIDGVQAEHPQNILAGKGYDHPFLLTENQGGEIVLEDEESGRVLTVETDQLAVVLYTGSQMTGGYSVRGVPVRRYLGLCLETQGLPDSIHHAHFPSSILKKGETFESMTKYRFGVL
ncbi:aldose epimerase family protein [Neobacillus sp. NPDC093127]|uniref:aldose epimerase family protein n=1 Tax=Neobacillus sp. NPDC093127 TaxID=3364296 RepID=UPI0038219894